MKDTLRVQDQERVDKDDFNYGVSDSQIEFATVLPDNVLAGDVSPNLVFKGFGMTSIGSGQVRVDRGVGLLGFRFNGAVRHGAIAVEGELQRIWDFSGYADGSYALWIRFAFQDGQFENRRFWNATTEAEFAQEIAVRRTANWQLTESPASPGDEWLKLGNVAVAGGLVTQLDDIRQLYFEGFTFKDLGSYPFQYPQTWGSANDRDDDRDTYGLHNFHKFTQATLKKIEELQSSTNPNFSGGNAVRWWKTPTYSIDDALPLGGAAVGANYAMRGDIAWDADNAYDIGDVTNRLANIYSWQIDTDYLAAQTATATVGLTGSPFEGVFANYVEPQEQIGNLGIDKMGSAADRVDPRIVGPYNESSFVGYTLWDEQQANGTNGHSRTYLDAAGGKWWTYNAYWDNLGNFQKDLNGSPGIGQDDRSSYMELGGANLTVKKAAAGAMTPIVWDDVLDIDFDAGEAVYAGVWAPTSIRTDLIERQTGAAAIGTNVAPFDVIHVDEVLPGAAPGALGSVSDTWDDVYAERVTPYDPTYTVANATDIIERRQINSVVAFGRFVALAPATTNTWNVASIVRNGLGNYTVTLSQAVNPEAVIQVSYEEAGASQIYHIMVSNRAASGLTFDILCVDSGTTLGIDPGNVNFTIHGAPKVLV